MPVPRLRHIGLAGVVTAALLAGTAAVAPVAAGADTGRIHPKRPLAKVVRVPPKKGAVRPSVVRSPPAAVVRPPVSNWQITYCGVTPPAGAKEAFQAAVDTWAGLIDTRNDDVPIRVVATFRDLGDPNLLGQASPGDYEVLDTDGNGSRDTVFPVALANARGGRDYSPGTPSCGTPDTASDGRDITAEFNSRAGHVYYGTDGRTPDNTYADFETIVLHELAHGLGFIGSTDVTDGVGSYGYPYQGATVPTVFDRFTVRSGGAVQGQRVLSIPNSSAALAAALTSRGLYWDGPLGKAAYNGRPPRLYAPSTFAAGSSYSHLDDDDFPFGDPNALMTPFISNDVIHDPGPVVLGMFADMGYRTPPQPGYRFTPVVPTRVLDTRNGIGSYGALDAGDYLDLPVAGTAKAVPADATAVVLETTGTSLSSTPSELTVFPTPVAGTARPGVSNLRVPAAEARTNLLTVPIGAGGRIRLFERIGYTHLIGDVYGWYGPSGSSALHPTDPTRIADTRDGTGGVPVGPATAGAPLDVQVTGGAVPTTATSVVLTVTALNPSTATGVRVTPTGSGSVVGTAVSATPGEVATNAVTVAVGDAGKVRLQVEQGSADVVVHVSGWYDDAADGALFHVLAADHLAQGRTATQKRWIRDTYLDVPVTGAAGVPAAGVTAAALTVTGSTTARATELRAYPVQADGIRGRMPLLQLRANQAVAASSVVPVGQNDSDGHGLVEISGTGGAANVVVDVAGWFGP